MTAINTKPKRRRRTKAEIALAAARVELDTALVEARKTAVAALARLAADPRKAGYVRAMAAKALVEARR